MATALRLMADTKYYDAYSRYIDEENRYEEWEESVNRVMDMHKEHYKDNVIYLDDYLKEAGLMYKSKRILGAQRALQFGGEQILQHHMRAYNCTSSYADRPAFFGEIFYILLCGAGTGFSVQRHHVAKVPEIASRNKKPKTFIVEDSIEGWASAVDVLMSSYFVGGGKHPEYEGRRVSFDTSKIRPKGSFISGGFKAPGPEGLNLALSRIERLIDKLISKKSQIRLEPINVYDIVMHIADAVLSGGVRRSAAICLFSHDDYDMINAKTGNWLIENPQRQRSNNSSVIVRDKITRAELANIMASVKEYGEPGFVFVDSTEHCFNPCVEIGMLPNIDGVSGWQGCNLTEINGGMCDTEEDFYKACRGAAILGTLQAGYTDFKFLTETSKQIFEREALIGVSVTGWMNNPDVLFNEDVLKKGAQIVKDTNKEVAKIIGINQAARTTCVKPSGTASILLNTASGIHPEHSPKYIRNMVLQKTSEVAQTIKRDNPYMLSEHYGKPENYIVSFPIDTKKNSIYKADIPGIKFLEKVKFVQSTWVEHGTNVELCIDPTLRHNVSNSVNVDNWDEVEEYVFDNKQYFTGISFLPIYGDKAFNQAPFQAVNSAEDIIKMFGAGSLFASGLITDALDAFGDLWVALSSVDNYESDNTNTKQDDMKRSWLKRFKGYSDDYFNGSTQKAETCLKDVYLLYKFNKIQRNLKPIDWVGSLTSKRYTNIDTMGAQACAGGVCDLQYV